MGLHDLLQGQLIFFMAMCKKFQVQVLMGNLPTADVMVFCAMTPICCPIIRLIPYVLEAGVGSSFTVLGIMIRKWMWKFAVKGKRRNSP
jgi:hypothetical protein